MRLCILTEYFDDTGSTPTILSNLASYLRASYPQLSIDVVTSQNMYRGSGKLASGVTDNGINVIRLRTPKSNTRSTTARLGLGMLFAAVAARHLLANGAYDLVLVVTNPPAAVIAARFFSRRRGVPYVYLIHDLFPDVATALGVLERDGLPSAFLKRLQRRWLMSAAKVVVLGRCMRDHLVAQYSLPANGIEVITNWCDPSEVVGAENSLYRDKHQLAGVTVLYAGNFGHYQDFDDMLDAAGRLRDVASHITFVLVGGGALEEHIKERVEREHLSNVKILPMVSTREYPDVLAAADIALVVLAPGAEGLGVPGKFYNILASARPTIAVVAPTSEVALVLAENECGVQVTHGDVDRLTQVIQDLAADQRLRKRLGHNAREALLKNYTVKQVGDRFWELFNEVVAA